MRRRILFKDQNGSRHMRTREGNRVFFQEFINLCYQTGNIITGIQRQTKDGKWIEHNDGFNW